MLNTRDELRDYLALRDHLSFNHFPPVSLLFIDTARSAIRIAREAYQNEAWELMEEIIELPNGLEKSVGEIINDLHLETFI